MLYRKGGEWALCPFLVVYTQHGQEIEQYTHDKQWWLDFAEEWDHTEIQEFQNVEWSDEEKARLEDIKHIPEGFFSDCATYVKTGLFPDEVEVEDEEEDGGRQNNHPLQLLQRKKEAERLGIEVSEREINEIMQGIQLSEIEIKLLMGGQ